MKFTSQICLGTIFMLLLTILIPVGTAQTNISPEIPDDDMSTQGSVVVLEDCDGWHILILFKNHHVFFI